MTNKKPPAKIPLSHDEMFKHAMSIPEVAKDFLSHHLPRDILVNADLNSLKTEPY